jgi:serine/threonine protein kinase
MQRVGQPPLADLLRTAHTLPVENRFAWLRRECQDDPALYHRAIAAFQLEITHPEWWTDTPTQASDQTIGMVIGRYRVIGKIGSGGMSDVLLAISGSDDSDRVAIKIIRRANASPQLHSRLKVERQILGALDHPNIARLLDGGSTSEGMPYLVMEYLRGEPLDQYCNRKRLNVQERLRLFQSICRAVHAAHRLSIVHRDLKPSNILVTAEGVPKLLDFGIAKVLDDRPTEATQIVTHADMRMLTPDYASPEQIRGDAVTAATDIYSLGVLLYELLTGCNPRRIPLPRTAAGNHLLPVTTLHGDSALSLNERIDEVTASAGKRWHDELCRQRSTSSRQLRQILGEPLNGLVLTALERDPAYRYKSAEAFATSIEQHDQPAAEPVITNVIAPQAASEVDRHVRWSMVAIAAFVIAALAVAGFALIRHL